MSVCLIAHELGLTEASGKAAQVRYRSYVQHRMIGILLQVACDVVSAESSWLLHDVLILLHYWVSTAMLTHTLCL